MTADFRAKTIETLAKRAGHCCSNPDCGVSTAGPNADPNKATVIGEAAHIYGARAGSARFRAEMTDPDRGEITNAIWLCRNCHKKVDRDADSHSADLLFAWREEREAAATSQLGNKTDAIRQRIETQKLAEFAVYPPMVRRIALDKPDGWEWHLTAELLRSLNSPHFRRLRDLREGLYTRPLENIEDEQLPDWIRARLAEMSRLVPPIAKLIERLNRAWGKPGEPGDLNEIHHTCKLLSDSLLQVINHEERLRFVSVSEEFEALVSHLQDSLGTQVDKLADLPSRLDRILELARERADAPEGDILTVKETVTFELPPGWENRFERELKKAERRLRARGAPDSSSSGCATAAVVFILLFVLTLVLL